MSAAKRIRSLGQSAPESLTFPPLSPVVTNRLPVDLLPGWTVDCDFGETGFFPSAVRSPSRE
jgi:hypothetical protein